MALQSGLGQGGGLNRDFSKASGFGTRPVSSALRTVQRLTNDKRPVSGHIQMRPNIRNKSAVTRKKTHINEYMDHD